MEKTKEKSSWMGIILVLLPAILIIAVIAFDPYGYYLQYRIDNTIRAQVAVDKQINNLFWSNLKKEGVLKKVIEHYDELAKEFVVLCDDLYGTTKLDKKLREFPINCKHAKKTRYVLFDYGKQNKPKLMVSQVCAQCSPKKSKLLSKTLAKFNQDKKKVAIVKQLRKDSFLLKGKITLLKAHAEWWEEWFDSYFRFW